MNKIENLKLRKIEPLEDQAPQEMMINSSSNGEIKFESVRCANGNSIGCQYKDYYSSITDDKFNVIGIRCDGKAHYCTGYPKGSGSGSGSGNSGSAGSGWDPWAPITKDYCRWCIWESCYNNPSGSGSGSGSTWISTNPVGSGDASNTSDTYKSYGFASSNGRGKVSVPIFIPQKFSPPNGHERWRVSGLKIRCCSKKASVAVFKVGLQYSNESSVNEKTIYGPGYAETTIPFSMKYNADTNATVYFSEDTEGGIFSWELLR